MSKKNVYVNILVVHPGKAGRSSILLSFDGEAYGLTKGLLADGQPEDIINEILVSHLNVELGWLVNFVELRLANCSNNVLNLYYSILIPHLVEAKLGRWVDLKDALSGDIVISKEVVGVINNVAI